MQLFRDKITHNRCPYCSLQGIGKDARHQLQCVVPERQILWEKDALELNAWLEKNETETILHK